MRTTFVFTILSLFVITSLAYADNGSVPNDEYVKLVVPKQMPSYNAEYEAFGGISMPQEPDAAQQETPNAATVTVSAIVLPIRIATFHANGKLSVSSNTQGESLYLFKNEQGQNLDLHVYRWERVYNCLQKATKAIGEKVCEA